MARQKIKNKYIFVGDLNSINIELIIKSFSYLKNKVRYILICNKKELINSDYYKKHNIPTNDILDPINFLNFRNQKLNIFNIDNISKEKYLNLLNQIKIANNLSKNTKYDLVTMPINKSIFKKKIEFIGMTEYLGEINKKKTIMLMHGEKFSVIPMTTHINIKNISEYIDKKYLSLFLKNIIKNLNDKIYNLNFKKIIFLCYNPHCSEENTLGNEDFLIKKVIKNFRIISGPYSADSAFNIISKNRLFISTYHDQALIPFKILNKKSLNLTLGLDYRRLSPAHGTAVNIRYNYIADNSSYITCLLF